MDFMPKQAVYLLIALALAAFTSTASAYVVRRKIDVRSQPRQPAASQPKAIIPDWTGPAIPATIWR
jgi:hypothetical protein